MLSSPIHLDSASKAQFFATPSAFRNISHTSHQTANPVSSTMNNNNINNSLITENNNNSFILDDEDEIQNLTNTDTSSKSDLIPKQVFIGGRKSKLAVAQSEIIKGLIKQQFPNITIPILALTTLGDQVQNKPLYSFGGKALWTKELEILLLQDLGDYHKLDLIVHSLKDMPTNLPEEFELGCIVEREDPSDAVLMAKNSPYKCLEDLPNGSVVGTSSVRRSAQLKRNFPHLRFESIRGNLQTRISKLDDESTDFQCIILATAGLTRVGLEHRITQRLDSSIMYHAVGQGALGIEIRKDDAIMKSILGKIEDKVATICCYAERALMRTLEGGCSVPIGVSTHFNEETRLLKLKGLVISVDGTKWVEDEVSIEISTDNYKTDSDMAGCQLAHRLIEIGAKDILNEINFDKINEKDE